MSGGTLQCCDKEINSFVRMNNLCCWMRQATAAGAGRSKILEIEVLVEKITKALWAYTLFVVEAFTLYADKTSRWHPALSIGLLIAGLLSIDWFLPRWTTALVFGAIAIPLLVFLLVLFWMFFVEGYGRDRDRR